MEFLNIQLTVESVINTISNGWRIYFPIAVFCVVVLASLSFFLYNRLNKNRKYILPTYWFFTAGTFISVFLLFWLEYCTRVGFSNPFLSTVVSTVKIFTFGYDWFELNEVLLIEDAAEAGLLYKILVFASATAPLLTANAVLVALGESLAILKSKVTVFSELHIFSELNEKSICLAEDIYRERGIEPVKIIFANTSKDGVTDEKNDILERVKHINGLTTGKSVFELTSRFRRKKTKFYLISSDETHNIENCISLYDKVKTYGDEIYIFSTLDSTEIFIDSIDKHRPVTSSSKKGGDTYPTKLVLINEAKLSVYNLLLRHPLYRGADELGQKEIFAVVIGSDRIAREFIKTSLWCGQMKEFDFKIKIIDDGSLASDFERDYGDLKLKAEAAGIKLNYEFIKADIKSGELKRVIEKQCIGANYYLISTHDDELTMNISEMIRLNVERRNDISEKPVVVPIIRKKDYYKAAHGFVQNGDKIKLYPSGCYCDIYKKTYITQNPLFRLARFYNLIYNIIDLDNKLDNKNIYEVFASYESKSYSEKQEFLLEMLDLLQIKDENPEKDQEKSALQKKKCPTRVAVLKKELISILDNIDEQSETIKYSNVTGVIHIFYKLRDMGLETVFDYNEKFCRRKNESVSINKSGTVFRAKNAWDRELSKAELVALLAEQSIIDAFAEIEHNRWVVTLLLAGWETWDTSNDKEIPKSDLRYKRKDAKRKLQVGIIRNDELPSLAKKLGKDTSFFSELDCIPIKLIEFGLLETLNSTASPMEILLGSYKPSTENGRHLFVEANVNNRNSKTIPDSFKDDDPVATAEGITDTVNV